MRFLISGGGYDEMVREDAHPPNSAPCATLGPLYSRVHVLQTVLNFETYVAWLVLLGAAQILGGGG
jgi:hypothetical protein